VQNSRATKFCTVDPSILGPSVCKLLRITLLAPGNSRWLLDFWRIYVPLGTSVCWMCNVFFFSPEHISRLITFLVNLCLNADKEGRHIGQFDAAVTREPHSLQRLLTNELFCCFLESFQANAGIFPRSQRGHLEIISIT